MNIDLAEIRQKWSKTRLTKSTTFWVVVGAIIFTLYLGFSRGGWVTGGSADEMAEGISQDAVVERLTSICVAQFNQDPLKNQRLDELKLITSSYKRSTYVQDQGWATMPGEAEPDDKVAAECAKQLIRIDE